MDKIEKLTSKDIIADNLDKLKQLFPTVFSEGKIVMEELQALLGDYIEHDQEFYQMTWAGKGQARAEVNRLSTGTLRPCKEDSKDWDNTQNIFIEGDNLEVLKLMQKSYTDKIKMIYIDPPYNTGKDFVYKDNYKDNLSNYLELTGQIDADGNKLSTNTDSDGRYHSNWLNMMYPRLKLARNLLTEDGVIFISIDDNEQANLKKICDEIFGEENFVISIAWRKSDNQANIGDIARVKEYIVAYSKNKQQLSLGKLPLTEKAKKEYRYSDDVGAFRRAILLHKTRGRHVYEVKTKSGNILTGPWMIKEEDFINLDNQNMIYWTSGGQEQPYGKIYLKDSKGQIANDFWGTEYGSNQQASVKLEKLMGKRVFDFPKSEVLLQFLATIGSNENSVILDFFAGSSTTSHAVMALNAEDGGSRRCISVQLPEPTDEKSEAFKAGYKTIAEISKERIRRAGELVKEENKDKEGIENLDVGFRVFKLDTSNIVSWDTNPENFAEQLDFFAANNGSNIKPDRSEEDVLTEILLKHGLDLTIPMETKEINGKMVYNLGQGTMYVCLADGVDETVAKFIGEWHKEFEETEPTVIFKDAGFENDKDKTNAVQTLRQWGVERVRSV